jgi:hypothetical protein
VCFALLSKTKALAFVKNIFRKRDGNRLPCSVKSPALFTAQAGSNDLPKEKKFI